MYRVSSYTVISIGSETTNSIVLLVGLFMFAGYVGHFRATVQQPYRLQRYHYSDLIPWGKAAGV